MIETRLGEFEEVVLLLVGILDKEAYAFRITDEFKHQTGRSVSIGAIHSALTRLEDKGFVQSAMGEPSSIRGGRRKRIYSMTAFGIRALQDAKTLRLALWSQLPNFSL